ncbi:hypothetical protein BFP70_05035 [Thioclava sp. SK-1]|uniref:acyltransferase family protein n=1 Tax=Thioclava sp. SK-1 TaxID=1889770 RepID=UPI000825665E|nr:acyltransferase family protein [Thioclava sp. SK-1]OCX66392.1 hypothetical protein BFP70_05035 [Thioclava sp. SK-1]
MKYRPEIDGLRSLAVIPVVAFHAGVSAVPGGFVGVDVFFVISGFLITSLLAEDIAAGRYSLIGFYERRARRILPALFVMIAACLPLAWLWLTPADLKDFSQSLVAVAVFSSNLLFWHETDYFAAQAELKPLLHTWSLAVEEQFYILFPLLLAGLWRLGLRRLIGLVAVLGVISFGVAQWGISAAPAASFYLLPGRAWELLAGALAALYLRQGGPSVVVSAQGQWLSWAGVALIVVPMFTYDHATPFPGLAAVPPVLGTVLIVLFCGPKTHVGRGLAHRVPVAIGLISYSAYLWHQPLLAFYRYPLIAPPNPWIMAGLGGVSFVLAWLSWRYIERPFRNRRKISATAIFAMSGGGLAAVAALGLLGHRNDGYDGRFHYVGEIGQLAAIDNLYDHFDYAAVVREGECHAVRPEDWLANGCRDTRARTIMLWGDSYAAALYHGLAAWRDTAHPEIGIVQTTDGNGTPFFIRGKADDQTPLVELNTRRLDIAAQVQPDLILLSWSVLSPNAPREKKSQINALYQTINKIRSRVPDSSILIVGPVPQWNGTLQKQMLAYVNRFDTDPPRFMDLGLLEDIYDWDTQLAQGVPEDVGYVSPLAHMCTPQGCLTHVSDSLLDLSAVDWGHLTQSGSAYLAPYLWAQIYNRLEQQM